ncbi:hypothetical protein FBUS_04224 [Fasciolopsis buskii]|uniref:Uncharacterized protein n=1 Tax=Fasciolopsis buskii TaxID=27845 RepID=A0A8E0VK41_9TREM|nr:hypothetical protein FBUS_04224 [Fasciolopsis buski]
MKPDELLQNKYERLCMEYNKLRSKHKETKDILNNCISEAKKHTILLEEKDALIEKLQQECNLLRLKVERMSRGLEVSSEVLSYEPMVNLIVIWQIHRPYPANRKRNQQGKLQASPNSSLVYVTMCQLSDDQPKHIQSLDQTITSLTKALADWTDAIRSNQRSVLSEDVKDSLIEQIARLERQLCDVSLQYQIERRRRRMVENEHSSTTLSELVSENDDGGVLSLVNDPNGNYSLMLDWTQERIYAVTDQAQYFAARVAFVQDELLCLIPYVTQLAQQAFHHQCENRSLRDELKSLHDELETVHSNALRQSAQMAEHVANLTEELQAIRARGLQFSGSVDRVGNDSGSISPHQSASSSCKKVSAEDSVKHCFHCIFYF